MLFVGGGGAQNDGYERLETFVLLEKKNELECAKENPQNYNSMFQIDLEHFKNSNAFREYLRESGSILDGMGAVFIGWFFVLLIEVMLFLKRVVINRVKKVR